MSLTKCPRCHSYSFETCPCRRFRCWYEESEAGDQEAATDIYSNNYISAAEEAAKKYWQDELYSASNIDVWMSEGYNGEVVKFAVEAEVKVEYTATEEER